MCKWGDTITLKNPNPNATKKTMDIDRCLVPIIKALNRLGIYTIASCCGHGKQPGSIILADGREIRIFSNFKDARKVDKLFPPIN